MSSATCTANCHAAQPPAPGRSRATLGRLPDFLVIGAAKSGTTTLYDYLNRHPQIRMPELKEPNFFSTRWQEGLDWYRALFEDAAPEQVVGEASTNYSHDTRACDVKTVAARIAEIAPRTTLIYLMRDPVARAYSYYREKVRGEQIAGRRIGYDQTFEQFLERHPQCVNGGRYIEIIDSYRAAMPDALLVPLLTEDLQQRPAATMRHVFEQLGVDPERDVVGASALQSRSTASFERNFVREQIIAPLRRIPGFNRLGSRLPAPVREAVHRTLEKLPAARRRRARIVPPPMQPATRAALVDQFRRPTERLADFLGRDLSHWLKP